MNKETRNLLIHTLNGYASATASLAAAIRLALLDPPAELPPPEEIATTTSPAPAEIPDAIPPAKDSANWRETNPCPTPKPKAPASARVCPVCGGAYRNRRLEGTMTSKWQCDQCHYVSGSDPSLRQKNAKKSRMNGLFLSKRSAMSEPLVAPSSVPAAPKSPKPNRIAFLKSTHDRLEALRLNRESTIADERATVTAEARELAGVA